MPVRCRVCDTISEATDWRNGACPHCHVTARPMCAEKTECYSRVVGFYRPVELFNPGMRESYKDRKMFKIKKEDVPPDGK